jgi:cytochrome c5
MKLIPSTFVICLLLAPSLLAEDGATVFKSKCAMCHAVDGNGGTPMGKKLGIKSLTAPEVRKLTDEQLQQTIVKGKRKMPSFDRSSPPIRSTR